MKKKINMKPLLIITIILFIIDIVLFIRHENYAAAIFATLSVIFLAYIHIISKINDNLLENSQLVINLNKKILDDSKKLFKQIDKDDIIQHINSNCGRLIQLEDMTLADGYGCDYYSVGTFFAIERDMEFLDEAADAAKRFNEGDFGDFYSSKENNPAGNPVVEGFEFGRYPSKFFPIMIHRSKGKTTMCFPMEE